MNQIKVSAMLFADRHEAGQYLSTKLKKFAERSDVIILCLPRGGVPVGYEIARNLNVPFDVFIVRKLGVPDHRELAMGAIASGGVRVLNDDVVRTLGIPQSAIDLIAAEELRELERRERLYRGKDESLIVKNKIVILVDDGLATGATMRAAVKAIQKMSPNLLVVAVPVASEQTCQELSEEVDEIVCAETPEPFFGVGQWYEDFGETTDEEVKRLLEKRWKGAQAV
jgi:putative phosphoribosyl transferase